MILAEALGPSPLISLISPCHNESENLFDPVRPRGHSHGAEIAES